MHQLDIHVSHRLPHWLFPWNGQWLSGIQSQLRFKKPHGILQARTSLEDLWLDRSVRYSCAIMIFIVTHSATPFYVGLSAVHMSLVCCVYFLGVCVAHPDHWGCSAGHGHWALLWCVRPHQRTGRHTLLLPAKHLLQKGGSFTPSSIYRQAFQTHAWYLFCLQHHGLLYTICGWIWFGSHALSWFACSGTCKPLQEMNWHCAMFYCCIAVHALWMRHKKCLLRISWSGDILLSFCYCVFLIVYNYFFKCCHCNLTGKAVSSEWSVKQHWPIEELFPYRLTVWIVIPLFCMSYGVLWLNPKQGSYTLVQQTFCRCEYISCFSFRHRFYGTQGYTTYGC